MTPRSDIPRLGASLGVLGTVLEHKGQLAYDTTSGWQHGPRKAPANGERGGGGAEGQEDRKDEARQRAAAAKHFRAYRADLAAIDVLTQSLLRKIDIACPPNPEDVKNRRTGELDPWTPAEVAIAGWCSSCWRAGQAMVPIEVNRQSGLRYHKSMCRWCGGVCATYKIDEVPLEMVRLHVDGRRIAVDVMVAAVQKAKQAAAPKKGKGRKGKRGKVAA